MGHTFGATATEHQANGWASATGASIGESRREYGQDKQNAQ